MAVRARDAPARGAQQPQVLPLVRSERADAEAGLYTPAAVQFAERSCAVPAVAVERQPLEAPTDAAVLVRRMVERMPQSEPLPVFLQRQEALVAESQLQVVAEPRPEAPPASEAARASQLAGPRQQDERALPAGRRVQLESPLAQGALRLQEAWELQAALPQAGPAQRLLPFSA